MNVRGVFLPTGGGHFEMEIPEWLRVVHTMRMPFVDEDPWLSDDITSRKAEEVCWEFSGWALDGRAVYVEVGR